MTFTGKGFEVILEEVSKDFVHKVNASLNLKYPPLHNHTNTSLKFYGFDFSRISLVDNFKELDLFFPEPYVYTPYFEKDKIYLITLKEFVGDIFSFEELPENFIFKAFFLRPFQTLICTKFTEEDIEIKRNATLCGIKQYLYYSRAGVFVKFKIYEE